MDIQKIISNTKQFFQNSKKISDADYNIYVASILLVAVVTFIMSNGQSSLYRISTLFLGLVVIGCSFFMLAPSYFKMVESHKYLDWTNTYSILKFLLRIAMFLLLIAYIVKFYESALVAIVILFILSQCIG